MEPTSRVLLCVIQPKATEFRKNIQQPTRGAWGLVLHHDLIENWSRYWGPAVYGVLTTAPRIIRSGRYPLLTTFVREGGLASPERSKGRRMRLRFPQVNVNTRMAAGTPLKYEQAIQVCSLPRKDFSMQIPTSLRASDHILF